MKRFLPRVFNKLTKRLAIAFIIGVAIALPVAALAADQVTIEATTAGANITTGQSSYTSTVSASYDQEVEAQVIYLNPNGPTSGKVANNVHVTANIPTTAGSTQVIATDTHGDNTNDVTGQLTVDIDNSAEYLQYVPGSTIAKVTNQDGTVSQYNVPDSQSPITSDNPGGYLVNNGNPCNAAGITFLVRVMQPGVKIVKQVEEANQSNAWATTNTADPGDTLKYMITYQNIGNTVQNQVLIKDNLPPLMTLVSGTTYVYDGTHPSGILIPDDDITQGGIDVGDYGAGAVAYIEFQVQVPAANQLTCGTNTFQNVGGSQPQGMQWYYNVATTTVNVPCTTTPSFSCNSLTVTPSSLPGNRNVSAVVNYSASNGATFDNVTINWGDGSTPLITNTGSSNSNDVTASYTYPANGVNSFNVTATANFTVNGSQQSVSSAACAKTVNLTPPTTTPPAVTASTPPSQLINTGPGDDIAGIFAGTSIFGAVGHRFYRARNFLRRK
ncbi:MAG TPA: hypothetical protein VMR34_04180 [Candidatus Saccharimonadales bacterium]|nr:hypothetical protein [Candidatus Saccharimonadales bacterium]